MPPRAITQICPQCEMPLVLPVSFIGQKIPCSRCGHPILVSGPTELSAAPEAGVPDVRPPHLREATGPAPVAINMSQTSGELDPIRQPQRRSCLYSGCVTVLVATLVLSAVVGMAVGAVYLVTWDRRSMVTLDGMALDGKFNKSEYVDASRKAITRDGVTVRIDAVQLGKVDFRSKGELLQTTTPHYLIVNVAVKNKTRSEPVVYQSWYDHQFEDEEGNRQDVELQDNNGGRWQIFTVPDADKVERHVKSEVSLSTDDEITDSLVFKLPEEYIDEPIPPLYLQLPGAALGDGRVFRFHLPPIILQRRDR